MKKIKLKTSIKKIEEILEKTDIPEQDLDSIDEEMHIVIFLYDAISLVKHGSLMKIKEVSNIIKELDRHEFPF